MNSFKSGSGNLDFGDDDSDDEEDASAEGKEEEPEPEQAVRSDRIEESTIDSPASEEESSDQSESDEDSPSELEQTSASTEKYPYFIRRSNVGDERDNRLEIHVRDKVVDQESEFRSELADHLGTNEVPKTDAREFALLDAFENPERIADRMREEGFGELE